MIKKKNWIFCFWKSHYKCLLKGTPIKILKNAILKWESISLCFPKYNIFSSAILSCSIQIALDVACAIKKKLDQRVYCFVGDMTSETGIMHESLKNNIKL